MIRSIACAMALMLPLTMAQAQQAGSTYPAGSNVPQRSAGEVAPKPQAQSGGSGGGTTTGKPQHGPGGKANKRPVRHGAPHKAPAKR